MNFDFKKLNNLSKDQVQKIAWSFWRRAFPYVAFAMFMSGATWIGYTWYKNIYDIEITQVERDEYVAERQREVEFREEAFQNMRDAVAERKEHFNTSVEEVRDIFFPEDVGGTEAVAQDTGEVAEQESPQEVTQEVIQEESPG